MSEALEYGAFGLLAMIVVWALHKLPTVAEKFVNVMGEMQKEFVSSNERARTDYREELRAQRDFHRGQVSANNSAIADLSAAVREQTVAIIAAAKEQDIDAQLQKHRRQNGTS